MKTLFSLAVVVLLATGCSSQPTQVVVTVDAEPGVRADSASVHLVVLGGASDEVVGGRFDQTLVGRTFPFELTLAPLGGDVGRAWEVVVGAAGAEARAVGGYVEGETLFVSLVLEDACRGVTCSLEETCRAGACVAVGVVGTGDAGTPVDDAGDAGIPAGDAGTRDAGHDAGVVDLGTDAGPGTDAGVLDAGPGTDAGVCPTVFQPGVWRGTSTRATSDTTCTPIMVGSAFVATTFSALMNADPSLGSCPVGATNCRVVTNTTCSARVTYDLSGATYEKELTLIVGGTYATGSHGQTPHGSCWWTIAYEWIDVLP